MTIISESTQQRAEKLTAVLESDAPLKEKVDACRELARIGTADAVPVLAALLGDEKLSHMARYALEPMSQQSVDDALRDALGRLKGRPLVGVIGSIGTRRDAKALPLLAPLLANADADVARMAARALGRFGNPEAAELLEQRLAGAPAGLRPAVADACLSCAEALLAAGDRSRAAAMYRSVGKADLPKHFRLAAMQGEVLTRQPAGRP